MEAHTSPYRRMPAALAAATKAWLGGDHVLLVNRTFAREHYRRFFLRDIQAFIIRRTVAGRAWNIVLGSAIGLVLVIAVAAGEFHPALLVTSVVLLVFLLVNLGLGPTCECHIRTAVNLQRMPMLPRLRMAERFLGILAAAVNETQGEMSAEEVRRQAAEKQQEAPAPAAPAWAAPAGLRRPLVHSSGVMHFVLFSVLLIGCGLSLLDYFHHTAPASVLVGVILLAQISLAVAAAVVQGGTDITVGLKATVWLTIAYLCVVYLLSVGAALVVSDYTTDAQPAMPFQLTAFALFIAVCSGALGLVGFIQLSLFRSEYRRRRAAAPPVLLERV